MNNLQRTLSIGAGLLCLAGAPTHAQPAASAATVEAHVAEATRVAGADLGALLVLCKPASAARPPQAEVDKSIAALIGRPPPPPGQAFDNLYYVGANWVSAWALKTSEGIILIDALNNEAEVAAVLEPGLGKVGLDPAQIKYVIVTHGHGDHYGGARYLVQKYQPRIVMSGLDWAMTETQLEFTTPLWGAPPKRDVAVGEGDKIILGDTTVTMYLTPGHTLGTISPVFEVKAGDKTHRVLLWGGTAFNFGKDIPRLNQYIDATQRMARLAREQQIDVLLSNHAGYDGTVAKLDALRQRAGNAPHPFVIGNANVIRALTVMGECAQATRDRFSLQ